MKNHQTKFEVPKPKRSLVIDRNHLVYGQTDRQTDRQTNAKQYTQYKGGIIKYYVMCRKGDYLALN
jgi:hypothetical protein